MHEEILFTPILGAHLLAGVGALTLAIVQVHFMSRGSKDHKKLGWVWAALMAFLAVSSLWDLLGDGLLSIPAHVFTLATVIFLPLAILQIDPMAMLASNGPGTNRGSTNFWDNYQWAI